MKADILHMRVCIFYITSGKGFPCKFSQESLIRSILEDQNLPFRIFYFIVPTTQEFLIVLGNFCCFTISRNYHIAPLLKLGFVVLTFASPLMSLMGLFHRLNLTLLPQSLFDCIDTCPGLVSVIPVFLFDSNLEWTVLLLFSLGKD